MFKVLMVNIRIFYSRQLHQSVRFCAFVLKVHLLLKIGTSVYIIYVGFAHFRL